MGDFGSNEQGFNDETAAYKRDPTIEHYVHLRRTAPEAEIEVGITGGIEQLFFMEPELLKYGFDPNMIAGVLDADEADISEISLQILEKIIETRRRLNAGETQLVRRGEAIPEKLIDWLICCALDSMSWNDDLYISRDLIVLIRERLGGANREYEKASMINEKRQNAALVAGQLIARGIKPTYRLIASVFKVAPSTVKRWFPDGEFLKEAKVYAAWFDENGKLKPLQPSQKKLREKQRAQRKSD